MLGRLLRVVLRKRLITGCDELSLNLFPRFSICLGPNGHFRIADDLVKPVDCLLLLQGLVPLVGKPTQRQAHESRQDQQTSDRKLIPAVLGAGGYHGKAIQRITPGASWLVSRPCPGRIRKRPGRRR